MRRRLVLALLSALPLLPLLQFGTRAGDGPKADAPAVAGDTIVVPRCTTEYGKVSTIGANIYGNIREIRVELGEAVQAGQVLGRLRDQDVEKDRTVAQAEAENANSIEIAEAMYGQAQIQKQMNAALRKRGMLVSDLDARKQVLETESARAGVELAKFNRRLAGLKRDQADALVHLREFICSHDGIVVDIYKRAGESILVNDPILRVAYTRMFRVNGSLDISEAWRARAGQPVRIYPEIEGVHLPIESEVFHGEVIFVHREVDQKSQTCRVIAEVKNRDDLLRSGLQVRMEIIAKPGADKAGSEPTARNPESGYRGTIEAPAQHGGRPALEG